MKVTSVYLGDQEIDPDTIISFPNGIPGFENDTRYKLFNVDEENSKVFWLQSLDDSEVMFSVTLPETFNVAYEISISDEELEVLDVDDPEKVIVLLVLSRPGDVFDEEAPAQDTSVGVRANLNSPLLINLDKQLAMQKVLEKTQQLTLIRSVDE